MTPTFTLVQVMRDKAKQNCAFVAVANTAHVELLNFCFPELRDGLEGGAPGNRGNQVEAIAWLTLESDRPDLLLAMAFHLDLWSDWPQGSDMATGVAATEAPVELQSDARDRMDLDEYLVRASKAAMDRGGGVERPPAVRSLCSSPRAEMEWVARSRHSGCRSSPRRA